MKKEENNLVFGFRSVLELLGSGAEIESLLINKRMDEGKVSLVKDKIAGREIPIKFVPIEKLNRVAKGNHQGIAALTSIVEYKSIDEVIELKDKNRIFLMLDGITDVHNFASIVRSAECLGVDAIILDSHNSAPINSVVAKVSSGAVFHMNFVKANHIRDAIFFLRGEGFKIMAVDSNTGVEGKEIDLKEDILLIIGSEGKGLSKSTLKFCDYKIRIDMTGKIESLNVAVSTGIILYEAQRQRNS